MQGKIIGTGLIALDVILNGRIETPPKVFAGGSCGNVLTILSFLGNESFPIARLADNKYTDLLFDDLSKWDINTSLISRDDDGNTPIIIHRIQKDKDGNPKHRFEFRNPLSGQWFPNYKPVLSKSVEQISAALPLSPKAFYFDRVNRASIELAKICKKRGAIVVFEPSSLKMDKQFLECLEVSHIIKFSNERIKNYSEQFPNNKVPLEIETLGSQGLKYRFKSDEWKIINSFFIENIFDTAGAGDWCTAGLINILGDSGLDSFNSAKQEIIEYSLLYGQALGALNCMFDGARGLMYNINKSEIDILVNNMILGENNRTHLMDINLNNKNKITLNKKFELSDIF